MTFMFAWHIMMCVGKCIFAQINVYEGGNHMYNSSPRKGKDEDSKVNMVLSIKSSVRKGLKLYAIMHDCTVSDLVEKWYLQAVEQDKSTQ